MWRSSQKTSRPAVNWTKVVLFAVMTTVIAYFAAANAFSNITRRKIPDLALTVWPSEPVALTLNADRAFQSKQDAQTLDKVEQQVKRALRHQPYNATAIRLLGYVADARGSEASARRLVNTAARLSRREFGAQIWLIEDAAQKERLAKALLHYDIALRTTFDSRSVLFPTLIDALGRSDVQRALVPYITEAPSWMLDFIPEAIAKIDDPSHLATLMMASNGSAEIPQYRNFPNLLLSQLASKRKYAAYHRYYLTLPSAELSLLNSVALGRASVSSEYPSAGWQLFESASAGSSFVAGNEQSGYQLQAYSTAQGRGVIARKLLFLDPGRYLLKANYSTLGSVLESKIIWQIQCLSEFSEVDFIFSVHPIVQGKSSTSDPFNISPGCEAQYLNLIIAGGDSQSESEILISALSLDHD